MAKIRQRLRNGTLGDVEILNPSEQNSRILKKEVIIETQEKEVIDNVEIKKEEVIIETPEGSEVKKEEVIIETQEVVVPAEPKVAEEAPSIDQLMSQVRRPSRRGHRSRIFNTENGMAARMTFPGLRWAGFPKN